MRVTVTDAEYPDTLVEEELLHAHRIELIRRDNAMTEDEVIALCQGSDGIITQYAPITGRVLAALPSVRVVSRYGTGYDNVDVDAATKLGVAVCFVPTYGTDEVAYHTLSLILAACREHNQASAARWTGAWPPEYAQLPQNPRGLVIGVAGAGRIGRRVLELCAPLFAGVFWYDPYLPTTVGLPGGRCGTLTELAAVSNVLTLHLPLNQSTTDVVDGQLLAALKAPRYLVNASRAGVVTPADLAAALEDGTLRAAGLDVVDPGPSGERIFASPRATITSHSAWASPAAQDDCRAKA
ncbi:MAG: NAD(P)-dependent oxidoreductase, partial [Propionicimonas sp.]|nr:NAD(P)-dependent oxidoreductase [Propionicimonas sp.]